MSGICTTVLNANMFWVVLGILDSSEKGSSQKNSSTFLNCYILTIDQLFFQWREFILDSNGSPLASDSAETLLLRIKKGIWTVHRNSQFTELKYY
jgi:hypothetical protein